MKVGSTRHDLGGMAPKQAILSKMEFEHRLDHDKEGVRAKSRMYAVITESLTQKSIGFALVSTRLFMIFVTALLTLLTI
jgi:hypothetical protein